MKQIQTNSYQLVGVGKINILLGRNGCGKSTILREISDCVIDNTEIEYITPQRGGALIFNAGLEQSIVSSERFLDSLRRNNQSDSFKQQTVVQYKRLELEVLRKLQNDVHANKLDIIYFNNYIDNINSLLDEIYIKSEGDFFKIYKKESNILLDANQISSGESELICLGIECLSFITKLLGKNGILLLDEPDVHLHPDLQSRFVQFLLNILDNYNLQIIIASHSTAIISALSSYEEAGIAFIKPNSYYQTHGGQKKNISFNKISDQYNNILPVLGAHPLTNIYCENELLLVEGYDDERVWQQVVRSSSNKIKLHSVQCGGIDNISSYEKITNEILSSVYNQDAKCYSIRDGDGNDAQLEYDKQIVRIRIGSYGPENFMLSNDVLKSLNTKWEDAKQEITKWLNDHKTAQNRQDYIELTQFRSDGYDRKKFKIKDSRNVLLTIIGSTKPWEVLVGQSIATVILNHDTADKSDGSLYDFLGDKLFDTLVGFVTNNSKEKYEKI